MKRLVEAAKLPGGGISEIAVNASLTFIENAKPRDEIECALLIQMACTHTAARSVLRAFAGVHGYDRNATLIHSEPVAARLHSPSRGATASKKRRFAIRPGRACARNEGGQASLET